MRDRVIRGLLVALFAVAAGSSMLAAEPGPDASTSATQSALQAGSKSTGAQPTKDKDGVYTLKSKSQLVVLDVIVRDANGNVVTDLTKDDFKVTEAGQSQMVLNFEPAGAHLISPDITIHSTEELDKLAPEAPVNILLLDETNTLYEQMSRARYYLKTYLDTQPEKLAMPTMLLAVSLDKFTVLSDYTQDKQSLLNGLKNHFPPYPWGYEVMGGVSINPDLSKKLLMAPVVTLEHIAEATKGHRGHKNLIWIGNGFPDAEAIPAEALWNAIDQSGKDLREDRMTLNFVMPDGVLFDSGNPYKLNFVFIQMAEDSGGKAYLYNDQDVAIGNYVQEGSAFYTLAYRPTTDSLKAQKFRKIVVTVNRPGLIATASAGYRPETGPDALGLDNPKLRLNFDLLGAEKSNIVYDAVPVTVAQLAGAQDSFVVHVDPNWLEWKAASDVSSPHANVIVMVSTFNSKGRVLKRIAKTVEVDSPTRVTPSGKVLSGMILPVKLKHDPKAVRVRFIVRDDETGRMGTEDFTLQP